METKAIREEGRIRMLDKKLKLIDAMKKKFPKMSEDLDELEGMMLEEEMPEDEMPMDEEPMEGEMDLDEEEAMLGEEEEDEYMGEEEEEDDGMGDMMFPEEEMEMKSANSPSMKNERIPLHKKLIKRRR